MKILLDNGHGLETPGKRSPDGKFLEHQYNRTIASHVTAELLDCGYDAQLMVPEISDIPLVERCRRVNAVCDEVGAANVILVSIHVNAAGSGPNLRSKQSPRPTWTELPDIFWHRLDYFLISACCQNEKSLYICIVKGEFAEGMTTLTA